MYLCVYVRTHELDQTGFVLIVYMHTFGLCAYLGLYLCMCVIHVYVIYIHTCAVTHMAGFSFLYTLAFAHIQTYMHAYIHTGVHMSPAHVTSVSNIRAHVYVYIYING